MLGVTGSIAAFRAAELCSTLTKAGVLVDVVMTQAAERFVGPITFESLARRAVVTDANEPVLDGQPAHIYLADRADLVLIAPATANVIAKYAHGIADNVLTSMLLATLAPVVIAPAMNGKMWDHPATQSNVELLGSRGVEFIGPAEGMLACGYEGLGRLWPVGDIAERVLGRVNSVSSSLKDFRSEVDSMANVGKD